MNEKRHFLGKFDLPRLTQPIPTKRVARGTLTTVLVSLLKTAGASNDPNRLSEPWVCPLCFEMASKLFETNRSRIG